MYLYHEDKIISETIVKIQWVESQQENLQILGNQVVCF